MGSTVGVMREIAPVTHSAEDLSLLKEIFSLLTGSERAQQVRLSSLLELAEVMDTRDSPFDLFLIEEEHDTKNEFVPWESFLCLVPMLTREYKELRRRLRNQLAFYGAADTDTDTHTHTHNHSGDHFLGLFAMESDNNNDNDNNNNINGNNAAQRNVYDAPLFPMYVLRVRDLLSLPEARLLSFEEALHREMLFEVEPVEHSNGEFCVYHTRSDGTRGEAISLAHSEQASQKTVPQHHHWQSSTSQDSLPTVNQDLSAFPCGRKRLFSRRQLTAVSHQWLRPHVNASLAHPDDLNHSKYLTLKRYFEQEIARKTPDANNNPSETESSAAAEDHFVWMDFFSLPQQRESSACQPPSAHSLAVSSLPAYFLTAGQTLVLVSSVNCFFDAELGYLSRAFCMIELLSSFLPRKDIDNRWFIPGKSADGGTKMLAMDTGCCRMIDWKDFALSPSEASTDEASVSPKQIFDKKCTNPDDIPLIFALIPSVIEAFRDFYDNVLVRVRLCSAWEDVCRVREELLPQTNGIERRLSLTKSLKSSEKDSTIHTEESAHASLTPQQWVESVLPISYIDLLSESYRVLMEKM